MQDISLSTPFEGELVDKMTAALTAEDPDAVPVPLHTFGRHGCEGSVPPGNPLLRVRATAVPADLDFAALFHGIDERVPVDALEFGVRPRPLPAHGMTGHLQRLQEIAGNLAEEPRALAQSWLWQHRSGPTTPRRAL